MTTQEFAQMSSGWLYDCRFNHYAFFSDVYNDCDSSQQEWINEKLVAFANEFPEEAAEICYMVYDEPEIPQEMFDEWDAAPVVAVACDMSFEDDELPF